MNKGISILTLLITTLLLASGCERIIAKFVVPDRIETFARKYIYLLKNNNAEEARELLHQELQNKVTEDDIKSLVEHIRDEEIAESEYLVPYFRKTAHDISAYILIYKIQKENSQFIMFGIAITEIEEDIRTVGVGIWDSSGYAISAIGPKYLVKLQDQLDGYIDELVKGKEVPKTLRFISMLVMSLFTVIISIVIIIFIVGLWKVYEKAEEPGWAIFVPIYNMYVLARIGDKPEWWGIAISFVGIIPIVGPIVGFALYLIISIGVAGTFERSVGFGLGLCFLPFIFYPILGLSKR